jgi:hypothetical protein
LKALPPSAVKISKIWKMTENKRIAVIDFFHTILTNRELQIVEMGSAKSNRDNH